MSSPITAGAAVFAKDFARVCDGHDPEGNVIQLQEHVAAAE